MLHGSNIKAFLRATKDQDLLVQAYCGLVAVELVLKHEVGLSDHNVCAALNRFRIQKAVGTKSWTASHLIALTNQLRSGIVTFQVNDKMGQPRTAPHESYPYIRYTRLQEDNWGHPYTSVAALQTLANTIAQVRSFLRTTFGLPL